MRWFFLALAGVYVAVNIACIVTGSSCEHPSLMVLLCLVLSKLYEM